MAEFKIRDKETGEIFTIREKETTQEQLQQQIQQPQQQPNILQQLLQATKGTIGGIAGGIIQPPAKIVGRAGQAIASMISGKPPQPYSIPMPEYLGGNIPIEPAQSISQALGPVAQTTAMMMGGSPMLAGATYGAGMGMEEREGGLGIAGKAALGGLFGAGIQKLKGKPVLPEKIRNIFKYNNALEQAQKSKIALDNTRTLLGKAKDIALQEVKDVPAELDWSGNVSQKVVNTIKNPIYKVEFTEEGGVVNTIGNLDKVKSALQDLLTTKDFVEAGNMEKRLIMQFTGRVRDTMVKAANNIGKPELATALKNYHNFMDNYNLINDKLVDKYDNAMANKLKATFKWSAEPAVKKAWKEVSKASLEIKSIMGSMNRRELLKNLLKVAGIGTGLGLAGKGATSFFKND